MDGQYPIKPFKPTNNKTTITRVTMVGEMGKTIVAEYKEDNPDIVMLSIQSNRGTTKDVIEMPIQKILNAFETLSTTHNYYIKED
jgi:hypothetical protein